MERPEEEIEQVLTSILTTPDIQKVRQHVAKYFAEDATFTHPLFVAKGREAIQSVYCTWARVNVSFQEHQVYDVVLNKTSLRLYVDCGYSPQPFLYYLIPQHVRVVVIFQLRRVRGGSRYVIVQQEDLLPITALVTALCPPPLGWLIGWIVWGARRLSGLYLVYVLAPVVALLSALVGRG